VRKLSLLPLCVIVLISAGCHGQVPPTNHTVSLTWTAPSASGGWAGCTVAAPCTYVISRVTVTGSSCPSTTGTNYTPINQSNPATTTSLTDSSASGLTVCYIAQTLQGSAVSNPSNTAGPLTVPPNPLAPSLNDGTVSEAKPLEPNSEEVAVIHLTAKVR
jgi:hypothetical protein